METAPLVAHCFVTPGPHGFVFTASAQEQTFVNVELPPDEEKFVSALMSQVVPVLASLKRKGFNIGLQVESLQQHVFFILGALLEPYLDGIAPVVPVTFAPGVEVPPAAPQAPPAPTPAKVERPAPAARRPPSTGPTPIARLPDKALLENIEKLTLFGDARVASYEEAYLARHGSGEEARKKVEGAKERAATTTKLQSQLEQAARRRDEAAIKDLSEKLKGHLPANVAARFIDRALGASDAARRNAQQRKERLAAGRALSEVKANPAVRHELHRLKPSSQWQLVIDETGFEERAPFSAAVGVLVPAEVKLPSAERFHAVDVDADRRDAVMQALLDHPVGVIGLDARRVPASSNLWLATVLELVGWTVRLMPLEGPTKLRVLVEQRQGFVADTSWTVAFGLFNRQLVSLDPERYGKLELDVLVVGKDHALVGYADVVAHAWSRRSEESRLRISKSGLVGACLMEGDPGSLRRAWDTLERGDLLRDDEWLALLEAPDASNPDSLAGLALARLERRCSAEVSLWERLLEAVVAHEQSKAVDLRRLGRQVSWLMRSQPRHALPRPLELAWLSAQLEHSNHEGDVDTVLEGRLEELSAALVDEAPALVCQADLNRAVRMTNAFRFTEASSRLARWDDARPREPGLQHWGRLLSQRGQHAAFLSDQAKAVSLFEQALDAFGRLSDAQLARLEQSQTASYLAVATMDLPGASPEFVRKHVSRVASLEPERIAALACDTSHGSRFAHHVLLRFLATHGSEAEKAAYLGCMEDWDHASGHPWQLILAYRAMLTWPHDTDLGRMLFRAAVTQTSTAKGTLKRIGDAIAEEAKAWEQGARVPTVLPKLLPFNFR